jgi:hypothetical protein
MLDMSRDVWTCFRGVVQRMSAGCQKFESARNGEIFQRVEKLMGKRASSDARIENDVSLIIA